MQKTYEVIYADPPWRYQQSTPTRKIENHYPTMSLEEIKELKVPAAKKSVLYLWTTTAKLAESISVIDSWGFEYKSSMVWDKLKYGMGFWFRGQHEFLLVATKGGFGPPPRTFTYTQHISRGSWQTQREAHQNTRTYSLVVSRTFKVGAFCSQSRQKFVGEK